MGLTTEQLKDAYGRMCLARAFERKCEELFMQGQVRGSLHMSIGQEASAAGTALALRDSDLLVTNYRGHGHALAKGISPRAAMAEMLGRVTGCCKGKGGSMHIADFSVGMLGANGVVAAGLPIAVGAAQAQKLKQKTQAEQGREIENTITVCFFGDGAINRGPFLEALNWAQVYHLPVLFVCEDNRWSATTESTAMTAGAGASARAQSLDIAATQVDGNDVVAVYQAAQALVAQMRAGLGPRLLHALTYRVKGHVSVDPAAYRNPQELAAALQTDPIARLRERFKAIAQTDQSLTAIEDAAAAEVNAALAAAAAAPWPDASAAYTDVQTTGAGTWY